MFGAWSKLQVQAILDSKQRNGLNLNWNHRLLSSLKRKIKQQIVQNRFDLHQCKARTLKKYTNKQKSTDYSINGA